jgi:hypothetical protein
MDFITGLSKVHGRDCIYMVLGRLTKHAYFFFIPSKFNTYQVADLFIREVFRLHGLPRNIVSDRDNKFLNAFGRSYYGYLG